MFDAKNVFLTICYDCIYYGYTWVFVKKAYIEYLDYLGDDGAYDIYKQAFELISNDKTIS